VTSSTSQFSSGESLRSLSLDEFLDCAGACTPTPGGGSVAAATASLAVSMARMVVAYSARKPPDPEHETKLEELAQQLQRLDQIVRVMIDEDAAAYQEYSKASRQVKREGADPASLQLAVKLATTIPLELLSMTVALLRLLNQHKDLMSARLLSDLAVAAHLALAACQSAVENVRINVFELESKQDRAQAYSQSDYLLEVATSLSEQVVTFVHQ